MKADERDRLISLLADRVAGTIAWKDILEDAPDLSIDDAYLLQSGLMRRLAAAGDPLVGYKASLTNLAMQKARGTGGPVAGGLLASCLRDDDSAIAFVPGARNAVEAEVAILLGADIDGPNVTALDVRRATAALLPAIEVAVGAPGNVDRSSQMAIATQKTTGAVILGGPGRSPDGIDLRVEGAVITVNGEYKATATAVEVMGDPYRAGAFIANQMLATGDKLRAGMILMTGSITLAVNVVAGDNVRVDFTRLGSVNIRMN
ncbi:MAG: hypothetical protein EA385_01885 [Salinarimonadaceae bacterium]|nr:MAG: hypothetical protein EA385_01885 [Salinarimonadaceae bacterium]